MGPWIAIIVVVVVVVAAASLGFVSRRRAEPAAVEPVTTSRPVVAPAAPMTDLESALAKVTDRDGRPIKERIDAETAHVDPLRDPDDTGPLLRRALDFVAHQDPEQAGGQHGQPHDAGGSGESIDEPAESPDARPSNP